MHKMLTKPASKERGITLIESLMVLGISAAFIAGGIALYGQANNANQAREGINEVLAIIASVQPAFSNANDYSGLGNGAGSDYGVGTPPWGQTYEIRASTNAATAGPDDDTFYIFMNNVPQTICSQMKATLNGVDSVTVGVAAASVAASNAVGWTISTSGANEGEPAHGASSVFKSDNSCADDVPVMVFVGK